MSVVLDLRRLLVAPPVAAVLVILSAASPVAADVPCHDSDWDCEVTAEPAGAVSFGATVVDLDHISGGEARSRSGASVCSYRPVGESFDRDHYLVIHDTIPLEARFFYLDCPTSTSLRWYVPGEPADAVGSGQFTELIQHAFDRIHTEPPTLTLSPSLERYQLTGMPTFLAIDPTAFDQPPDGTITAGPLTVTAWLHAQHVDWQLGNDDTRRCEGPGNTYDPTRPLDEQTIACPYTYTTRPAEHTGNPDATSYPLTATITYTAHYRIDGLPDGPLTATLGNLQGPPATGNLEVRELRAVRTTTP